MHGQAVSRYMLPFLSLYAPYTRPYTRPYTLPIRALYAPYMLPICCTQLALYAHFCSALVNRLCSIAVCTSHILLGLFCICYWVSLAYATRPLLHMLLVSFAHATGLFCICSWSLLHMLLGFFCTVPGLEYTNGTLLDAHFCTICSLLHCMQTVFRQSGVALHAHYMLTFERRFACSQSSEF